MSLHTAGGSSSARAGDRLSYPVYHNEQLLPWPRGSPEPRRRRRRQIDRWAPIDNPPGERLPERRQDREPRYVAAAREEEAANRRRGADYMLSIPGHCGNAAAMLA